MTNAVKTRLSNSILIGDIFGMLIFGLCIDKFGRRVGIILTTLFLVLVCPHLPYDWLWESFPDESCD